MAQPFLDSLDLSILAPALRTRCSEIADRLMNEIADNGYEVSVSRDLDDLDEFWSANRGQPTLRITSAFHRLYQPSAAHKNTLGVFLERGGRSIGTQWYRLIPLIDKATLRGFTLKESMESLRFFYEDPDKAPKNERCICRARVARRIEACVVCYAGALWIDPRYQGMFSTFVRLGRLLAVTTPDFTWSWAVAMTPNELAGMAAKHFGGTSLERGTWHKGEHLWLVTAPLQDAIDIVLATGDRHDEPFGFSGV